MIEIEKKRSWRQAVVDTYMTWSPWLAGYLILFFILFFTGAYWYGLGSILTSQVTMGWAAAVATFVAAVVALKVAGDKQKRTDNNLQLDAALEISAAIGEIVLADAYSKAAERLLSGREADPQFEEAAKNLNFAINHLNNVPIRVAYRHNPRFGALLASAADFSKGAEVALRVNDERVLVQAQKILAMLAHATNELVIIGKPIREQYRYSHLTEADRAAFE